MRIPNIGSIKSVKRQICATIEYLTAKRDRISDGIEILDVLYDKSKSDSEKDALDHKRSYYLAELAKCDVEISRLIEVRDAMNVIIAYDKKQAN